MPLDKRANQYYDPLSPDKIQTNFEWKPAYICMSGIQEMKIGESTQRPNAYYDVYRNGGDAHELFEALYREGAVLDQ